MAIETSCSMTFNDISFTHTHPGNDSDGGEHLHKANVTLTFNAHGKQKSALPITTTSLKNIREKLIEIESISRVGYFEESAEEILKGIREWLPELKRTRNFWNVEFDIKRVSIEVHDQDDCDLEGVYHPNLPEADATRLTYTAECNGLG